MSVVPAEMPQEKRAVLDAVCQALKSVSNVVALVLGGSYASGFAEESSDIDIGVYYRESAPLAVDEMRAVAEAICTPGSVPVVTDLYGWGPWVNGGAWIQTPATKVDLVYRNLDQVRGVIEEGCRGVWRHDYDQQPPYGFRSVVYFGETRCCIPLHDPAGEIARLKASVAVYPEALKQRITQESLWGAEFSMWSCDRFATSADVYNAAGCMTRAAQYLVHALFALNEEYLLNDKHVHRMLARFAKIPRSCGARLAGVLARPGRDAGELQDSLDSLRQLWAETVALTEGAYQPRFDLTAARTASAGVAMSRG
jgi:hypothetical protein